MRKTTPCISLALGIGSVLSIAPTVSSAKLSDVSKFNVPNASQNINQYWHNVGGYVRSSLAKAKEAHEQRN
ncbi:hypothetical protein BKG93_11795 [Rodentibacter ratti]|uniref:Uncharacterized protein n=2 Tax=Rodentibacter TaxID=1960084 RepID=A0A1V3IL64_9PAST|nr:MULTISPECIES: hypothetical protein [Rodentibacter]OOF42311.1 hypothetical protein BKK51_12955 [Rodentibacter trehalosifermentans]OOF47580.1 hypothetical protein BKK52_08620 [Rodentibacter trehalosifermentans]OOF80990.1 hypothetical protein BKG93_11795 [Rodentibacter ratti]